MSPAESGAGADAGGRTEAGARADAGATSDAGLTAGLVFGIARGSAEDGPGLRTTVFLKGCPLRCCWCHSPESQSRHPELAFQSNRCIGCGSCVETCTCGALTLSEQQAHIDWQRCDGCLLCTRVCPSSSLRVIGEWLTVDDVVDIIARDTRYYERSAGGATFSGGEPLSQPSFLKGCASRCKELGIHVAVDTCGYAAWSSIEQVLSCVDLFLFDLKVFDRERHVELTGVDNRLILDNFMKIREHGKSVWVRVPLIPGCTDSDENIAAIRKFVGPLRPGEELSLLPYNPITAAKYASIGRIYPLT